MKNRFFIASKAASLYNEISSCFVIPGVKWVAQLRLLDATEDVIKEKAAEIEKMEVQICADADTVIMKVRYHAIQFVGQTPNNPVVEND